MATLYLTADHIGDADTGAGKVTFHERQALQELGMPLKCLERANLDGPGQDPWKWDAAAYRQVGQHYQLAHVYAGTFGDTVRLLQKAFKTKVTYTAAAHDVAVSKREHEAMGYAYNYPHLTEPAQWARYLQPYKDADVLICPSHHSERVMRGFGCTNPIEVIPHGVTMPEHVAPLPEQVKVGYLGSCAAPDKGVRYLLAAWAELNLPDAVLLLGGRDSISPPVMEMVLKHCPKGNVRLCGWVTSPSDFYNQCSLYIQPSASEGFGCEIPEAMAHARSVICSDGAGAADVVGAGGTVVPACNVQALANALAETIAAGQLTERGMVAREVAYHYTWDIVRERYKTVWRGLLA